MSTDNIEFIVPQTTTGIIDGSRVRRQSEQCRPLRIAYVGPAFGTSRHRIRALERLGHTVTVVDPWSWLGRKKWISRWLHHTGGVGSGLRIGARLIRAVTAAQPELIFVNQGEFIGPRIVKRLRETGALLVNFTNDNPFVQQASARFAPYRRSIPYYDLLAVSFQENVGQALAAGARSVMRVWLTADEQAHLPRAIRNDVRAHYEADVAFVGTWMPERGAFMKALIQRGVPLSIWGDRWQKAPEWPAVAAHWRGAGLYDAENYAAVIQSAKVCLGLLSKGNRNLHTNRSVEIPALGGLLLAQRTTEHLSLYREGSEAVFWRDARECAEQCHRLLADDTLRETIARNGHERCKRNNSFNEPMLKSIINEALRLGAN